MHNLIKYYVLWYNYTINSCKLERTKSMENNILLDRNNEVKTAHENVFDINKHYDSVNELAQLIDAFSDKLEILNNTFYELKEGKLSNKLTASRRDELLNQLSSEKDLLDNLYNGFSDALEKDIRKLDRLRINSNVNTDIFKDYLETNNDEETMNTSQMFYKMHK